MLFKTVNYLFFALNFFTFFRLGDTVVCQFAECVQEIFRFCFSEFRVSVSVLARAITEKAEVLHLFDRYKVVDDVALFYLRPGQRIADRAKIFGFVKRKQHRNHRCLQVGIEYDNSGLEG